MPIIPDVCYTIDATKIADKSAATGITDYPNHNGNPPVNNNPNSNTTANSAKLYRLNSNTNKTGLGITLKVMAGDRIDIFGKSYYFTNNTGGTGANSAIPVLDILTGLLGGPTGGTAAVAHGGVTASQLSGIGNVTGGITTLLGDQTTDAAGAPTVPKAYINYIFFDEQFKVSGSGFSKVGSNSVVKTHTDLTNKTAPKNGYVYIYVSNESPVDVFFDNLQVIHTRGAILEETHYYPFGLTMAGISSKALNNAVENRIKFQGQEFANKEFSDGGGLDWYEFKYRMHDPQIGRFLQIDPLADKYVYNSPYAFSENKVTGHVELEGLESISMHFMYPHNYEGNTKVDLKDSEYRQAWLYNNLVPIKTGGLIMVAVAQPEVGIPLIVSDLSGVPVTPAPQAMASTVASTTTGAVDDVAAASTIERNAAQGAAFEQKVVSNLASEGHTNIEQQITIKAGNGVKTRLDAVSTNTSGQIALTEAKSSSTAPLTGNQKVAFPSIAQNGEVVVGKGKPGYPGGTVIPPTQINIVRPPAVDNTYIRPVVPIIPPPQRRD